MTYAEQLTKLTARYNDAIRELERSYNKESTTSYAWNLTSSHLRRQYSKRYEALQREYRSQKHQLLQSWKTTHPEWSRYRRWWERFFVSCCIGLMVCCTTMVGMAGADDGIASSAMSQDKETTYWNAENIVLPHLQDASQYVSNPDQVLTQDAVERMNTTLQRLDSELGIESVVIVVNHIENDDPFRMAQDVGNKYGVGRSDRGLVVVVGYEDHSINMSPGRSLEGDLTDAECHRLEQQYVVPAMRAQLPDSGMIYLVEAVYATLQQKQLPQMSQLSSQDADEGLDGPAGALAGISMLVIVGGAMLFLRLNRKYHWMPLSAATMLLANPFYESSGSSGFIGGGGFGGGRGGGGGGFSGGSFGGGSFGGGGATSRW